MSGHRSRGHGEAQLAHEPLALERIVFFSDAVIAIAITLLAIDLRLPNISGATEADFLKALGDLLPQYFAFFISFAVISIYWVAHHRMFRYIVDWDGGLIGLNLVFLFFVVQQPLLASILGSYGNLGSATAIYAAGLALMGFASVLLWLYAFRRHLVSPDVTPALVRYVGIRSGAAAVVFAVSVPLAFISPVIAQFSWLTVAFISFAFRHRF